MCDVCLGVLIFCYPEKKKEKKKRGSEIRSVPIVVQNREEVNTEGSLGEITEQWTHGREQQTVWKKKRKKKKEGEETWLRATEKQRWIILTHTALWPRSAREIKQEDYTLAERLGSLLWLSATSTKSPLTMELSVSWGTDQKHTGMLGKRRRGRDFFERAEFL